MDEHLIFFIQNFLAPNVYEVNKADKIILDKSPKYSFGSRPETEKPADTPG